MHIDAAPQYREHLISGWTQCLTAEPAVRAFVLERSSSVRMSTINVITPGPYGFLTQGITLLNASLRRIITEQTILWEAEADGPLKGMEDPVFYRSESSWDQPLCWVISHEPMIYLYITETEWADLISSTSIQWDA